MSSFFYFGRNYRIYGREEFPSIFFAAVVGVEFEDVIVGDDGGVFAETRFDYVGESALLQTTVKKIGEERT